jgi:predicted PurR-regulated permease PerM
MLLPEGGLPSSSTGEASGHTTRPNLDDTARLFPGPLGIRSLALTGLFLLACFYTLYFARDFFLPVVLALVLNFLLAPVVRFGRRFHLPKALSAAFVIAGLVTAVGGFGYELSNPLREWLERVPELGAKLQAKVRPLHKSVEKISKASDQVEGLASIKATTQQPLPRVEVKRGSLVDALFSGTSKLVLSSLVMMVLLFFLLASGDLFLSKLVHVLPALSDKKKAIQIAREVEENISHYLFTITLINASLGLISALIFCAFGLPNPALWGVVAGVLNFIPTVGSLSAAAIVTVVAVSTFPSLAHALSIPATYLGLAITTGTFVTPLIMGRRLTLNPVVIFLALSFWGWLWGIPGALLAVPMLAMFKIFCDHIEPLAPVGEFLGH